LKLDPTCVKESVNNKDLFEFRYVIVHEFGSSAFRNPSCHALGASVIVQLRLDGLDASLVF